ncbi:MAG: helix-turn-helix domain-containing protein [Prevotella sp.]|nr:helix-turn-helix domain-containing protein [Prevotella sp.]
MKRLILVFLIPILAVLGATAQTGKLFNADNHLSSNLTAQVFQDADGFIWIATQNGLNRYDGYQFRVFMKEDGQSGISGNYINCVAQSRKGTIYVGSNVTVQTYDGGRFNNIQLKDARGNAIGTYINYIMETSEGIMLACTSGYGIMRLDEKSATGQTDTKLSAGQSYIRFAMEDTMERLWILTESNGIVLVEGNHQTKFFQDSDQKSKLMEIRQDPMGNVYAAVYGKGIYQFDDNKRTFEFIEETAGLPIRTFYPTRSGQLLLGCDGQGMFIYNPHNGQLTANPFYSNQLDMTKGKVSSILEDRNGNIWVCLLQKGLFMQPKAKMDFGYMGERLGSRNVIGTNSVTSTLVDSKGRLWLGTDKDGLYLMDGAYTSARHFTQCPSTILSMAEDKKGRIWLGSYNEGCGWIDPATGQWHPENLQLGNSVNVFGLTAASNGDVWIATMGNGLMRINIETGQRTHYTMKQGADTDHKMNSIPNNFLTKICLSHDERRLFVACSVGFCCYDIANDSWTNALGVNCTTPSSYMCSVYADSRDRVWLGTYDGLYCYDLRTHKERYYTTEDGLPTNSICSVINDKKGNLWLGTYHGLCCFNPEKMICTNYYVDNGLQGNEFSEGTVSRSASGNLIFGGTGGISWFNPADIQPQTWKARVYLTGLMMGQTPITTGMKSGSYTITDSLVINSSRFDFCHDDNSFTLQLSTFTYDNPEHITYYYSINGEEWNQLQTGTNEITFSRLTPGTYDFRIKAVNNQQETDVREFTIKVHAPWYASWWAIAFYLLLAALAAWLFIRSRQRKMQNQLRLQEHIHAEQMADAKLRFFMNISHEIRTPMTLIVTPLQSLIKQDKDPQRQGLYETMRRNAERIVGLINQMMDLRKIDKGLMQMRMRETDLIGFLGDIYAMFSQQAKTKNIEFSFEHDAQSLPVWIDRSNFDKVVVNILSNAFKFTKPGGMVDIKVTHDEKNASISFYNNGEKIPEEQLQLIFKRFYQLPTTANDRNVGTGIGLDLTRSLVELHHGTIKAQNTSDGCEFVVTIPLGNSHLQPDEMITDAQEQTALTNLIDEKAAELSTPAEQEKPKRRKSIVIVEDDEEIRNYLCTEFSANYDVTGCSNGLEGLKEVLKTLPDLVISDIMMPEMDGSTLCSKIKLNPSTNHIPVILLTAKNRDEDHLEGLETGADAYIVKPFNMDILSRTVINLINKVDMLRLKYGRNDQLEEQVEAVTMKSPDEKLLERVMKVINNNISNSDLSVDRIAEEVGISRVHLHRKMKELTGQTPHDFIRNIRLKQAAHLLVNQSMNITEVMYACGFNSPASFSTIFKKFYGLSPRDYMREYEKDNE